MTARSVVLASLCALSVGVACNAILGNESTSFDSSMRVDGGGSTNSSGEPSSSSGGASSSGGESSSSGDAAPTLAPITALATYRYVISPMYNYDLVAWGSGRTVLARIRQVGGVYEQRAEITLPRGEPKPSFRLPRPEGSRAWPWRPAMSCFCVA